MLESSVDLIQFLALDESDDEGWRDRPEFHLLPLENQPLLTPHQFNTAEEHTYENDLMSMKHSRANL